MMIANKIKRPKLPIPDEVVAQYKDFMRAHMGMDGAEADRAGEQAAAQAFFFFGDPDGGVREINDSTLAINGTIRAETFDALAKRLGKGSKVKTIQIDSTGGVAHCGVACYNLLRDKDVRVEVMGMAFSAASVIAMAGNPLVMRLGATLGIHRPWAALMAGNADELRVEADILDALGEGIFETYAARLNEGAREEVWEMYQKDSLLTGKQAVELGMADEYEKAEKPKEKPADEKKEKPATPAGDADASPKQQTAREFMLDCKLASKVHTFNIGGQE